jgi:hypothetical protein
MQLQQAAFLQPTFATVWLGNNDVLGAALSGVVIDDVTLTTTAKFDADYKAVVNTLVARGAKLALATIPDVTSIPFVTTVPRVVVNPQTRQPVLVNGQPVPILGPNGPLGAGDFVLLTGAAQLQQGIGIPAALGGTGLGLGDQFVLSASEVATIRARTAAFNGIIAAAASQAQGALVDIAARFTDIVAHGYTIGGITYTTAFLTGGLFSYDGVHPTPFGYAFLANEFIAAINRTYGGSIPPVDLFPFMFGPEASAGATLSGDTAAAEISPEGLRNLWWALAVPEPKPSSSDPKGTGGRKHRGKGRGGHR